MILTNFHDFSGNENKLLLIWPIYSFSICDSLVSCIQFWSTCISIFEFNQPSRAALFIIGNL